MGKRKVFVSVASLIPWSLGSGGPGRAIKLAEKAGFDGLQVLPLRGWTRETIGVIPADKVVAYEGPWNHGSLVGAVKRHLGLTGEKQPLLIDWILFGPHPLNERIFGKLFPEAMRITHFQQRGYGIYEIHPEGGFPLAGLPVCWDTFHTRRPYRNGFPPSYPWQSLLRDVKRQIALIHVHPVGVEIEELIDEKWNSLREQLAHLADLSTNIPIVLEVRPTLGTPARAIEYLSRLRQAVA